MSSMSIFRIIDPDKQTVILTYAGRQLTPEMDINDPAQLLDVLSRVIDDAYNKLRDAGVA
jgi:hypothetical protein